MAAQYTITTHSIIESSFFNILKVIHLYVYFLSQISPIAKNMRAKKTILSVSGRSIKSPKRIAPARDTSAQTYGDNEPLIFSFDEDLEREEKERKFTAPIHHLSIRTI